MVSKFETSNKYPLCRNWRITSLEFLVLVEGFLDVIIISMSRFYKEHFENCFYCIQIYMFRILIF
jgi:hypothetical protein